MINKVASGNFEADMIRVKIIFPDDHIIYVDNYGGINFTNPDNLKLTSSDMKKAKKILEDLTAIRDSD